MAYRTDGSGDETTIDVEVAVPGVLSISFGHQVSVTIARDDGSRRPWVATFIYYLDDDLVNVATVGDRNTGLGVSATVNVAHVGIHRLATVAVGGKAIWRRTTVNDRGLILKTELVDPGVVGGVLIAPAKNLGYAGVGGRNPVELVSVEGGVQGYPFSSLGDVGTIGRIKNNTHVSITVEGVVLGHGGETVVLLAFDRERLVDVRVWPVQFGGSGSGPNKFGRSYYGTTSGPTGEGILEAAVVHQSAIVTARCFLSIGNR